jgi:hypothetical protein
MAWPIITFWDMGKSNSITVNRPGWGYETEIHMPIAITQAEDGTYPENGFFDPLNEAGTTLGTYDYRVLSSSIWRMTNAQKNNLNSFMRSASLGRAQDFIMSVEAIGVSSGFYPFDPTLGDNGDYQVRIITQDQSGKQMRPFRWYEEKFSMVMVSHSTGTIIVPTARAQGKFFIGSIATGFMYPQAGFKPMAEYCYSTDLSITGVPSSMNGPVLDDSWTTSFELVCNASGAYQLVNQLVNVTRTADINLVVPTHFDVYGADWSVAGVGGTYKSKFLGSSRTDKEVVLKIIHEGYDRFRIPLTFWLKEKTA